MEKPTKKRRRNLGRQARRRRKKALEIEAVAFAHITAATTCTVNDKSNPNIIPTDRGYVVEDVKQNSQLSNRDRRDLVFQLGYLPGNAMIIVARVKDFFSFEDVEKMLRCATSYERKHCNENGIIRKTKKSSETINSMMDEPLVLKSYPLVLRDESSSSKKRRKRRCCKNDSETKQRSQSDTGVPLLLEPFPTIYWITHPLIKGLISKLELDRFGYQFEKRLIDGEEKEPNVITNNESTIKHQSPFLAAMKSAHKSYANERLKLLSKKDIEYVKYRRWDESAFAEDCGVAGIRNHKAIKCLHAHAAHYWSGNTNNVIGRWVWEELKCNGQDTRTEKLSSCTARRKL